MLAGSMTGIHRQYASAAWVTFCKNLQVHHIMTMVYHPQGIGMAERTIRQLKEALRAYLGGTGMAFTSTWVLLGFEQPPRRIPVLSS
jgi:hypothetical protein